MSLRKLLVVVVVAVVVALYVALDLGRFFSLDALKAQQAALDAYRAANPWLTAGIYFLIYVAVTALLGFQFSPRIRDLPSKRLYLFDPASCPKELKGLIGGKIKERLIVANWPDILRSVATMACTISARSAASS